jgi:hypothetical protein
MSSNYELISLLFITFCAWTSSVVWWSEFLATDPEVPGSIPGATRFCWVVALERGPLSIVSTIEQLLGRKSSGYGLESREYCRRDPSRWPRDTVYPQTLALTSLTSGGRLAGIGRSQTQATEFVCLFVSSGPVNFHLFICLIFIIFRWKDGTEQILN